MFRSIAFCLALVLGVAQSSQEDVYQFNISLDGNQEVPSSGSAGTGFATAFFDNVSGSMTISGTFSGLGTSATAGHLHGFAAAGSNAGVLFPMTVSNATSGTMSASNSIANSGSNFANTLGGLTYLNIHTSGFPGGEIRGQLINPILVPEPGSLAMLSLAGLVVLARRRRI